MENNKSQEILETGIRNSVENILMLAEKYCWNKLSPNLSFILSDFNEFKGNTSFKLIKSKREINNKKILQSLETIIEVLKEKYSDLYDVVLYVFESKKEKTIIEIEYFRKSSFDINYFEKIKNNKPMFHAKILTPYDRKEEEKFDINWKD